MKIQKICFDVDGVISKAFLGLDALLRKRRDLWNTFLFCPLGRFIYLWLRRPNKRMINIIRDFRYDGHLIIIATYVFEEHRKTVEAWFKRYGVPYDKLFLSKKGEKVAEFKARVIKEEGCDLYIEDDPALIQEMIEFFPLIMIEFFPSLFTRMIYYRPGQEKQITDRILANEKRG